MQIGLANQLVRVLAASNAAVGSSSLSDSGFRRLAEAQPTDIDAVPIARDYITSANLLPSVAVVHDAAILASSLVSQSRASSRVLNVGKRRAEKDSRLR